MSSNNAIGRAISVAEHQDAAAENTSVRRLDLVLIERPAEISDLEATYGGALHETRVPIVVLKIECHPESGAANQNASPYGEFLDALEKMLMLARPAHETSRSEFKYRPSRSTDGNSLPDFDRLATTYRLTPRERQVLERVLAGDLNKQTAFRLMISQRTVEHHRASVMLKMRARTMADLMRIATQSQGATL